jgi:sulfite exporter TauE/SafE
MSGMLTIGAAFLLGLSASGHCLAMCGGLTAALGLATARTADGRVQPTLLLGYQLGRITSYTLAGLLFSGLLGGVIALLDVESVRRVLRGLAALTLLVGALIAFGRLGNSGSGLRQTLWRRLAPIGRRFLPVDSLPRAFAFGMVWGWMPCGFVYTVLLIATLQHSAPQGAIIMAAFGLGTMPALFLASLVSRRYVGLMATPAARRLAGSVLLVSAIITLLGPWLSAVPQVHDWLHVHGAVAMG